MKEQTLMEKCEVLEDHLKKREQLRFDLNSHVMKECEKHTKDSFVSMTIGRDYQNDEEYIDNVCGKCGLLEEVYLSRPMDVDKWEKGIKMGSSLIKGVDDFFGADTEAEAAI